MPLLRSTRDRGRFTGTRSSADLYLCMILLWTSGKDGLDRLTAFSARMRKDTGVMAAIQAERP
ncbi:hypothetical protein B0E47_14270 [Rhodanobacter sp. B05]|nr:hypothetical protein B0E47_14270 [Rhodanobacter sp. B05]